MIFNSFQFIWSLPLLLLIYYMVLQISGKCKLRITNFLLIAISYGLYLQWNVKYVFILLGITIVTYLFAIIIEKHENVANKRLLIASGIILTLLPLLIFKYLDFAIDLINSLSDNNQCSRLNLIAPLGISFYTFQALGYLLDVYHKRIRAEYNLWDYMLFVCFFPQIASGPISRASELLPQIKNERTFDYGYAVNGLKLILWGMFLKVVFADRIGIYVNVIYDNYQFMSGLSCIIGCVLYSLQIYGDFAGYSYMAIGVGQLFGFNLINNFNRPYFASSITEFWKRWHISLTRWLTQYVYIPLGGSRCSKPRQYLNILVTFLVSGIWHGANWTFVVWGGLHGILQVIEKSLGLTAKSDNQQKRGFGLLKPVRIVVTFCLVSLAWVFFRMPTLEDSLVFISKIFTEYSNTIAPITTSALLLITMSIVIVVIKEIMDEYLPEKYSLLNNQHLVIRWMSYVGIFYLILMCGVFDAGSFIYVNF